MERVAGLPAALALVALALPAGGDQAEAEPGLQREQAAAEQVQRHNEARDARLAAPPATPAIEQAREALRTRQSLGQRALHRRQASEAAAAAQAPSAPGTSTAAGDALRAQRHGRERAAQELQHKLQRGRAYGR